MSIEQIQIGIKVIPILIAIMFFALIILLCKTYQPKKEIFRIYERVNGLLKEKKKGFFNYDRMNEFLISNGAAFHYGSWIDPIKYFALCFITAVALFVIVIQFNVGLAVMFAFIGYGLPGALLRYLNKKDNAAFLPQIETIYNALAVQIKAGVYVSDALSECYRNLPSGRLRNALEDLSSELFIKNAFKEAIQNFNSKFDNGFIDSLCIILLQAQESGQAVELLRDMSEQLKDMRSALLQKKKAALDRTTTFCILGILAAAIAVIVYACVMYMFKAATNL